MQSDYEVIQGPVLSEKSMALVEIANQYTFKVALKANKHEIKTAIKNVFKVGVLSIKTVIVPGKTKRVGKFEKKRSRWKKAIVQLPVGQKISLFYTAR